ncbi:hypothetical protein [Rufibacter quisquiliarum]|uniref:DUF3108 domain-containing protein n=1 Tax=Rufibacter quisquiliarum TaxID=1549639 RepID=A0A839GL04_9BACT|nr:hypothetical protein [Rufibacter quisquiliarum]MBA9077489.1 hypothetical protein [Rufibacter quisquiliarum]
MKTITKLVILTLLAFLPEYLFAQDCTQPLGLSKNTEFIYQVTDKGRENGILHNKVVQQMNNQDGVFTTTFKSARMDKNKRTKTIEEFRIRCNGDSIYLDAKLLLREQALKAFDGKDFDFTPKDIAYPKVLAVGQQLPTGKLGVRVRSSNVDISTISMVASNRKVVAQEKLTTPAGTFDCFKITYQYEVELDARGIALRDVYQVEEFFSPEHGIIKCQFTNKRGKKAKGLELISKRAPVQALQN